MSARAKLGGLIVTLACACTACDVDSSPPQDAYTASTHVPGPLDVEPPPWRDEATSDALPGMVSNDAQIVATLEAIVSTELNLARVALQRAKGPDVRDLASSTAAELGRARARLAEATSLHEVRRAETRTIATLRASAAQVLTHLLAASPADFDGAYLKTLASMSAEQAGVLEQLPRNAYWTELRAEVIDLYARLSGAVAAAQSLEPRAKTDAL